MHVSTKVCCEHVLYVHIVQLHSLKSLEKIYGNFLKSTVSFCILTMAQGQMRYKSQSPCYFC